MNKGNNYINDKGSNQVYASLNPLYFLPDERSISDFLKFINRLSKLINFYNEESEKKGDWFDFFIADELFLLAEIQSFDIKSLDQEKTELLLKFDKTDKQDEKESLINTLFLQLKFMLKTIDGWYTISSKSNKQISNSPLEKELEAAISYRCKEVYLQLNFLSEELNQLGSDLKLDMQDLAFGKLWDFKGRELDHSSVFWGNQILKPEYLLKQLLLLHRPLFKTLVNLIERSGILLLDNLERKQDHEPHIGLLLAFFQLFQKLQEEINTIPDRLLSYYFEEVLGQVRRQQTPDTIDCYVMMDPEGGHTWLPKGIRVLAGQNEDGQDIIYEVEDPVKISPSKLVSIYTLYVSRNTIIDPGSSFQTVNGFFFKKTELQDKFKPFLALGEEQHFLSEENKSMKDVEIGFAISSPTLYLKGGDRNVKVSFFFINESYQYFLTMLLSVAKANNSLPEEVFHQLFSNTLKLEYTTSQNWCSIEDFEITPPQDWNQNGFFLTFRLAPGMPEFASYQEEIHLDQMNVNQPVLRIKIKNKGVYHPYSFLQFLELEEIKISVDVKKLKSLTLFSSFGPMDQSVPFDLFGPSPKVGSYLLIGNNEIFSKDLDELKIGWTFFGLPNGEDLKSYFSAYPYGIENDSFKLKIQALSDFRFLPEDNSEKKHLQLFEVQDGVILKDRLLREIDLAGMKILPDYSLSQDDLEEFPYDQETGYIKLELVSPQMGFGFDVYSEVYNKSVTMSTNKQIEKPKSGFSFDVPKEPFSPMATDIFLEYKSSSEINFLGSKSYANQREKKENFLQLHPFGKKFLLKDGFVFDNRLLPYFELQGAMFLGIDSQNLPSELSFLFEIGKKEGAFYGDAPNLEWFYLSNNDWKAFRPEEVLFDGTIGLTRSGIISFKTPQDINKNNQVMPAALFWICCRAKSNAEMASIVSGVYLNAFSAKAILDEERKHPTQLPAFSVQSFDRNISGVLEVIQPVPSYGGRLAEDKFSFYRRVSESLKHKYRAVTSWDIEKLLMAEFDWLGFVKVFGNFGNEDFVESGNIIVVGVPRIFESESFYLPKLNPGQLKEIEQFLKKVVNPFLKFKVLNPQYEYLMIKGKIKFHSSAIGTVFNKLYKDLIEGVCPWFYQDLSDIFSNRESQKSEILNLIISRSYVKFLTGFSLAHLYQNDSGDFIFSDAALLEDGMDTLKVGKPWSVIVPYPLENLELIEEESYSPPEPFNIENLILGKNLIIASETTHSWLESGLKVELEGSKTEEEFHHFTFRF